LIAVSFYLDSKGQPREFPALPQFVAAFRAREVVDPELPRGTPNHWPQQWREPARDLTARVLRTPSD